MFRILFLKNFFAQPVVCYEFLNTLYSIVKPASDFWYCAALHFVVMERNTAITAWNARHLLKTQNVLHSGTEFRAESTFHFVNAAFRCGIIAGKCFPPLWNIILLKNATFRCRIFTGMCFLLCEKADSTFRSVIAAFRSVNTVRNAALFEKLGTNFTIEYRVFKN